jgi:hypothetical protein
MPTWLRSAATTFIVTFIGLVPVTALVGGDTTWITAAVTAAILATLRTIVAAIDPGNTSYGIGAPADVPELDSVQDDAPIEGDETA